MIVIFASAAQRIFQFHPELDEVWITSDGQGFTSESKASNNATYLKDQKIQHYQRSDFAKEQGEDEPETEPELETELEPELEPELETEEGYRARLEAEYEKLYGKKPAWNAKTETIAERIAEKKG